MKRPPRRPNDPLLSKILLSRMILVSSTMAIVTLSIVFILTRQGQSVAYIQTVAFMSLISAQWINAFNARSEHKSSFSRVKKLNKGLFVGFAVALSLQLLVIFGPLGPVFNIQPIPTSTLVITSGIMVVCVLGVSETHKLITKYSK